MAASRRTLLLAGLVAAFVMLAHGAEVSSRSLLAPVPSEAPKKPGAPAPVMAAKKAGAPAPAMAAKEAAAAMAPKMAAKKAGTPAPAMAAKEAAAAMAPKMAAKKAAAAAPEKAAAPAPAASKKAAAPPLASTGRRLQQALTVQPAPAPAPAAAARSPVDGVLALTAAEVHFINASAVTLSGLANTTSWVKFPPAPKAGSVTLAYLVSQNMASSGGSWAGSPQAALYGLHDGNVSTVLMQLDAPKLDPKTGNLTFTYKLLPANETGLTELGGTVNTLVANKAPNLLGAVAPATVLYNASLVVDVSGISAYVDPSLGEKAGLIRIPLSSGYFYPGYGYWG